MICPVAPIAEDEFTLATPADIAGAAALTIPHPGEIRIKTNVYGVLIILSTNAAALDVQKVEILGRIDCRLCTGRGMRKAVRMQWRLVDMG